MNLLTRLGILEIAFSACFVSLFLSQKTQQRFPDVVKDSKKIRQAHLDYFFMGILLILAGTVLQPIPNWIAWPLVLGSLINPTSFLIEAFAPNMPKNVVYRYLTLLFCGAAAFAWAALGVRAVM